MCLGLFRRGLTKRCSQTFAAKEPLLLEDLRKLLCEAIAIAAKADSSAGLLENFRNEVVKWRTAGLAKISFFGVHRASEVAQLQ